MLNYIFCHKGILWVKEYPGGFLLCYVNTDIEIYPEKTVERKITTRRKESKYLSYILCLNGGQNPDLQKSV